MAHHGSFKAYKITNTRNGKAYIGVTSRPLAVRWAAHVYEAGVRDKGRLMAAIRKHGPDAFIIEHIASSWSWDELCALEKLLVLQEGTYLNGYNATMGGEGTLGLVVPPHIRERISLSHKKRLSGSPEALEALRQRQKALTAMWTGTKQTPEHRENGAKARRGLVRSAEARRNYSKVVKTAEWKRKISAAKMGHSVSDEARAKVSAANKGRIRSDEVKARLSAIHTRRWALIKQKEAAP